MPWHLPECSSAPPFQPSLSALAVAAPSNLAPLPPTPIHTPTNPPTARRFVLLTSGCESMNMRSAAVSCGRRTAAASRRANPAIRAAGSYSTQATSAAKASSSDATCGRGAGQRGGGWGMASGGRERGGEYGLGGGGHTGFVAAGGPCGGLWVVGRAGFCGWCNCAGLWVVHQCIQALAWPLPLSPHPPSRQPSTRIHTCRLSLHRKAMRSAGRSMVSPA